MKRGMNVGLGAAVTVVLLAPGAAQRGASFDEAPVFEEVLVPLEEISAFEAGSEFLRGETAACGLEPDAEGRTYPSFASESPLYGAADLPGGRTAFALDESGGTGKGYDRLILDLDRDGDLTNDEPRAMLTTAPPRALRRSSSTVQQARFPGFRTVCEYGEDGVRPVTIMPLLRINDYDGELYRTLSFFETTARRGRFTVGDQQYRILLGHQRRAGARLDGRGTTLLIRPLRGSLDQSWWGGDELAALHVLNGTLFSFSATAVGDRLTVRPYTGPYGMFVVDAGGRKIDRLGMRGSIGSTDRSLEIGAPAANRSRAEPTLCCRLPVGDYLPRYLSVQFGDLEIDLSNNYHSDGNPRARGDLPKVYGIQIREDAHFVLDFAREPDVMFASPALEDRLHPGDELSVQTVLVVPGLDAMIRGLEKGRTSLDPTVLITRADGEKVVTGVMPFG